MNASILSAYVSGGSKLPSGWFARVDAEIFRIILERQNENNWAGAVAEIGVHHGRSFIAMCLALQDSEKAYCIDVFEAQHLNKDLSGRGNRVVFQQNLEKYRVDLRRVIVDAKSSQDVRPNDIMAAVGPVRLFSIDGGHWQKIVESDLKLAESCISEHGVIALDDFQRSEWPEVSAGYFGWYIGRRRPVVPFAIGFNKLYICQEQFAEAYKRALAESSFLSNFLNKEVVFQGAQVPVYQPYLLPEQSLWSRFITYAKIFSPDLYVKAKDFRRMLRALLC
jgi:hypothetical protein